MVTLRVDELGYRGLLPLYRAALLAARERSLTLNVEEGNFQRSQWGVVRSDAMVWIKTTSDHTIRERHLAHELSHVIASAAGFSFEILMDTPAFEALDNLEKEEVCWLQPPLGSYLTHIAVHSILAAGGYSDPLFDNPHMELQYDKPDGYAANNRAGRANLVGLDVQYEELKNRSLPSIDLERFRREALRLNPHFQEDMRAVRRRLRVRDVTDIRGCLESTRSLATALTPILGYDLGQVVSINLAWSPSDGWDLSSVLGWLPST